MSVFYSCLRTLKYNTLAYECIFQKIECVRYVSSSLDARISVNVYDCRTCLRKMELARSPRVRESVGPEAAEVVVVVVRMSASRSGRDCVTRTMTTMIPLTSPSAWNDQSGSADKTSSCRPTPSTADRRLSRPPTPTT